MRVKNPEEINMAKLKCMAPLKELYQSQSEEERLGRENKLLQRTVENVSKLV